VRREENHQAAIMLGKKREFIFDFDFCGLSYFINKK